MRTLNLFPYQERQIRFLLDAPTSAVLVGPTSSGKSAVLRAAAKRSGARGFLCLTPQVNLEMSLARPETYVFEDGARVEFPSEDWIMLRDGAQWSWTGFGLCTHARARSFERGDVDLTGVVVAIDEAHHHGEGTDLHRFVAWVLSRGAVVWSFTATPVRWDRRRLFPEGIEPRVMVLPQVELMQLGWPQHIDVRFVRMGTPSTARAAGRLAEEDYTVLTELLLRTERQTLVGVTAGSSVQLAGELAVRLAAAGIPSERILVTTGSDTVEHEGEALPRGVYVERMLERDRAKLMSGDHANTYRVLIDCARCVEGMDAPGLSHLLQYGVPRSLPALIQKIGRVLRRKVDIPGYPAEWASRVLVTLAVPDTGDDAAEHARAVEVLVQIACYFHAPEVAYDYMGFFARLAERAPPHAAQHIRDRGTVLPEEEARLRRRVLELGVPPTTGKAPTVSDFLVHLERHVSAPAEAAAVLERFLTLGAEVEPAIYDRLKVVAAECYGVPVEGGTPTERAASVDEYDSLLLAGYQRIAWEFAGLVVPVLGVLDAVGGVLTPEVIASVGRRMAEERDAVYDLTAAQIATIFDRYQQDRGRALTGLRGVEEDLSAYVGGRFTQTDLDRTIRRQWPGLTLGRMVLLASLGALNGSTRTVKLPAARAAHASRLLDAALKRPAVDLYTLGQQLGVWSGVSVLAAIAAERWALHPPAPAESALRQHPASADGWVRL